MVEIHGELLEQDEEEAEEISLDEPKKRMWKDRMHLEKLKNKKHDKEEADIDHDEPQTLVKQEASRRKMSRAQDSILQYMVKIMEIYKAQCFVYWIVPDKGKPEPSMEQNDDHDQKAQEDITDALGSDTGITALVSKEGTCVCCSISEKRKRVIDQDQNTNVDKLYACQNTECPQSEMALGFVDKNARTDHESLCAYRTNHNDQGDIIPCSYIHPSNDPQMTGLPAPDWFDNIDLAWAVNENGGEHSLSEAAGEVSNSIVED
ncbi:Ethylene insensitive 3-like protein [Quillaja saponaria]|uniref:Ethylene insensitive 3-like protein n=1 Tax=Quillaja saponaria TaxID=32244 RepID=A0AAD7KT99_QUISA|nr:Ethylene insensitive 3-like protein [Quillaja saponaria]